jgi:hypothetical protein
MSNERTAVMTERQPGSGLNHPEIFTFLVFQRPPPGAKKPRSAPRTTLRTMRTRRKCADSSTYVLLSVSARL